MRLIGFILVALLTILGCDRSQEESFPPSDHPYYPSALLQNKNTLYVVSSNFDQRYNFGSLLSVNLDLVNQAISKGEAVGKNAVTSSGFIPSLSDGAIFSPKKDRIVYVSRSDIALRSVPLGNEGRQIACETTGGLLGQNCYLSGLAAELKQSNPYFVNLFSTDDQEIQAGLIGYLLSAENFVADGSGNFLQPQYFEFERFTWNKTGSQATIEQRVALGDLLRVKVGPALLSQTIRTNLTLGSVVRLGDLLYVLAETPPIGMVRRSVNLLRVSGSDLADGSKPVPVSRFDITQAANMGSLGLLEIATATDHLDIFVSSSVPGFISKFELPLQDSVDENGFLKMSFKSRIWVCDNAADMKLSPDKRKLVVACANGIMRVYDAATLAPLSVDPPSGAVFGRGPVKIHFDQEVTSPPFRFYTANFRDGSVSIFDLLESADTTQILIARKGHIFEPSAPNHEGGTEK